MGKRKYSATRRRQKRKGKMNDGGKEAGRPASFISPSWSSVRLVLTSVIRTRSGHVVFIKFYSLIYSQFRGENMGRARERGRFRLDVELTA